VTAASDHDEVLNVIQRVARQVADGIPVTPLVPSLALAELGIGSMQLMELVAELEDAMTISIPDDVLIGMRTIDDIAEVVEACRRRSPKPATAT
jgi:acyl carrier protein